MNYFGNKCHQRCSTGFYLHLWYLNFWEKNSHSLFHVKTSSNLYHYSCFLAWNFLLFKMYMRLLKVTFFVHFFSLNLWTRTCSSVICITISNSFSSAVSLRTFYKCDMKIWTSNNVLRNFLAISLTYNMSVICCNFHEY